MVYYLCGLTSFSSSPFVFIVSTLPDLDSCRLELTSWSDFFEPSLHRVIAHSTSTLQLRQPRKMPNHMCQMTWSGYLTMEEAFRRLWDCSSHERINEIGLGGQRLARQCEHRILRFGSCVIVTFGSCSVLVPGRRYLDKGNFWDEHGVIWARLMKLMSRCLD